MCLKVGLIPRVGILGAKYMISVVGFLTFPESFPSGMISYSFCVLSGLRFPGSVCLLSGKMEQMPYKIMTEGPTRMVLYDAMGFGNLAVPHLTKKSSITPIMLFVLRYPPRYRTSPWQHHNP